MSEKYNVKKMLKAVEKEVPSETASNSPKAINQEVSNHIRTTATNSLSTLLDNFNEDVQQGNIRLEDMKEAKLAIQAFDTLLQQQQTDNATPEAPQMPANVINFYSRELKAPKEVQPLNSAVNAKLANMSADRVSQLIQNKQKSDNNSNAEELN